MRVPNWKSLPKLSNAICNAGHAWVVGSWGKEGANDLDIVVPFDHWEAVSAMIPRDAAPNKFGGWRFMDEGVEVDVWPGDPIRMLKRTGVSTQPCTGTRIEVTMRAWRAIECEV